MRPTFPLCLDDKLTRTTNFCTSISGVFGDSHRIRFQSRPERFSTVRILVVGSPRLSPDYLLHRAKPLQTSLFDTGTTLSTRRGWTSVLFEIYLCISILRSPSPLTGEWGSVCGRLNVLFIHSDTTTVVVLVLTTLSPENSLVRPS